MRAILKQSINKTLGQHQTGSTQAQDQDSSLELKIKFQTSLLPQYTGKT